MPEHLDVSGTLRRPPAQHADPRRRDPAKIVLGVALPLMVVVGALIGTLIEGPDDPVRLGALLGLLAWVGSIGFVLVASSRSTRQERAL